MWKNSQNRRKLAQCSCFCRKCIEGEVGYFTHGAGDRERSPLCRSEAAMCCPSVIHSGQVWQLQGKGRSFKIVCQKKEVCFSRQEGFLGTWSCTRSAWREEREVDRWFCCFVWQFYLNLRPCKWLKTKNVFSCQVLEISLGQYRSQPWRTCVTQSAQHNGRRWKYKVIFHYRE